MLKKEIILKELSVIIDPELHIDIVKLGLIRDIEIGEYYEELGKHEYIKVMMTLTTPMCPYADHIVSEVKDVVNLLGAGECEVSLSFDPPWECPQDAKLLLGL
jgi:metal-sulfur cluster biosynthetic enzyme